MGSHKKHELNDLSSEYSEADIEEQIVEEPEEEYENAYIKQFYDAIPEISKLARTLIAPKPMRKKDLKTVLCRIPEASMSARGVLSSHRAKKFRTDINAGCGFDSPAGKPYRPFESGVAFEESANAAASKLQTILNGPRKAISRKSTGVEIQEIVLDQMVKARVSRYSRKFFSINLDKYPRAQVKGRSIVVTVDSIFGDPDLYMSIAEPPTEREYVWRSLQEGSDKIEIHPDDPNYLIGTYYMAVYCSASDCEFHIKARACRPLEHDDAERFTRAQFNMYESIRSSIRQSAHRLKLCAGGKSWHEQLQRDAVALQSLSKTKSTHLHSESGRSPQRTPSRADDGTGIDVTIDDDEKVGSWLTKDRVRGEKSGAVDEGRAVGNLSHGVRDQ